MRNDRILAVLYIYLAPVGDTVGALCTESPQFSKEVSKRGKRRAHREFAL
jgi:hypothetical protein